MSELLHEIIEDGICEVCEEPALPYDSYWELPMCAQHTLEYLADVSLEDYADTDPQFEGRCMLGRLTQRDVVDTAECCNCCGEMGMSRLAPPGFMHAIFNACTKCARQVWIPAELENRADWVFEMEAEFDND